MGRAVAEVLDALPGGRRRRGGRRGRPSGSPTRRAGRGADHHHARGSRSSRSPAPTARPRPRRMIAHIARTGGKLVGWSNTDGIYIDGVLVEAGDYSGPSGAGRVLAHQEVELAVTETARGGILLKGIGLTRNDVSVVTNVTADHLGLQGIDTLDQLAEVKAVVPQDHPQGRLGGAQRRRPAGLRDAQRRSRPSPGCSPATRTRRRSARCSAHGGRATTVIDGWVSVLTPNADARPARRAGRRPDDAGRAVALQRREHAGRRVRRPGDRHPAGRRRRRA